MNYNFYLRDPKLPETTVHLVLRRSYKGKLQQVKLTLSIKVKTSLWDKDKQMLNAKQHDYVSRGINAQLLQLKNDIEKARGIAMIEGRDQFDAIIKLIKGEQSINKNISLVEAFELFFSELSCKITSRRSLTARLKTLLLFSKSNYVSIIDKNFDLKYVSWLKKNYKLNSAHNYYKAYKQFCSFLFKYKYIERFDFETINQTPVDSTALTFEQVQMIKDVDLSADLNNSRILFLIMCYSGVRVSDLPQLLEQDFETELITYRSQKTSAHIFIPVTQPLRELLKLKPKMIAKQNINYNLREIIKRAGVNIAVTNHTARRTFVTLSLQLGVPAELVMKVTGHTSAAILQKYIRHNKDYLISELNKAWK